MPLLPDQTIRPGASVAPAFQFGSGEECQLGFAATGSFGPNANQGMQGTLTLSIGVDGAVDSGTLALDDGTSMPVVGQVTGRSIRLRIGSDADSVLTLIGSGVFPIDQCTGDLSGAFAGPGIENVGVWLAVGQGA